MQLSEIAFTVSRSGSLKIPASILQKMGLFPGSHIRIAYLTQDGQRNSFQEFLVSADSSEELSDENQFYIPDHLLEAINVWKIFPELQIITPEQFERVGKSRQQRAADYEAKCAAARKTEVVLQAGSAVEVSRPPRMCPKRNSGKSLLSGNVFCGHCGGRIFSSTTRKNRSAAAPRLNG